MGGRPKSFAVVCLEHVVMEEPKDGLEGKKTNDEEANYRVIGIDLVVNNVVSN